MVGKIEDNHTQVIMYIRHCTEQIWSISKDLLART